MGGPAVPWPDILIHTQFPADRFALRKAALSRRPVILPSSG